MSVAILGAGNWGTTLGLLLAEKGITVTLWEFFKEREEELKRDRENKRFLPGFPFPPNLGTTSSLAEAVSGKEMLVFVVPSHTLRSTAESLKDCVGGEPLIVSGMKGIEEGTLKRMSEVIEENLPERFQGKVVALLGPSIANEVVRKIPTAVVAANEDTRVCEKVQNIFSTSYFRVYTNNDIVGVELGGAVKNVVVIASGICDGMGLGANTKAALLTRGLAELKRFGLAMGAKEETFSGLSGIGDLITTAFSKHSRNRYVGEELGKGRNLDDILKGMVMVAEGVKTTHSVKQLSEKKNIDMPITSEVYNVLFKNKKPEQGVYDLMTRELRRENW
ncbi:MAG: NAD(P)H-dependent glycerol-3-phosphate dehydrogenase [Candidatus Cloacimonadota bacterium]|nr:MAG: NAD(P)H-dependent glycerol-3-phosphate dehydrogenase [Candidatus Cloacimonadota bacterium]